MTAASFSDKPPLDVLIIGAGISGIGMAYWLQKKCPNKQFAILEGRDTIGGTWSLFRYPGIRSDSDMFTFGYRFKPWQNPQSLSDGKTILTYLTETVTENGIGKHIRLGHKVLEANWSDKDRLWTLLVQRNGENTELQCRFLSVCSGYYNYEQAHRPHFPGEESFRGPLVIPQFWPEDLNYRDKKVIVVGSGATAVTLVPAMADRGAAHVTMLQRSPTYVMNLPNRNGVFAGLKKVLPNQWAYRLTRWMNLTLSMASFVLAKWFPRQAKSFIMKAAARQLPPGFPVHKHFNPTYNPWDQRLCVVPDGDLFASISSGKASVVTDQIERFTEMGIVLASGQALEADIIVLATGLTIRLMGGTQIKVNGQLIQPQDAMIYKGMMVSDVPNLAYAFGYTNASWTLKVDLTANYICKLLNYMDRHHYEVVKPIRQNLMSEEPFLNLNSSYIQRAAAVLPKQGAKRPWRVYQNYLADMLTTRFGRIADGVLTFQRKVS
ncbi:flavin-containing monooxygenase [Fibrella forsythiae]|uniref:NAD(P)/FAD-dependent oxidoreductase n=1 Tax=Fibrella forsythiae TaxID=2817061 RepID=A0ABS3JP98_9BACT|nr:NAD(P)/FAD-dependent oxidoreductase [Fibrella forsythiae]MBO0951822.1 NAD(P)/FAD-dependent oxidoreductase [Fibrella forsythiae]